MTPSWRHSASAAAPPFTAALSPATAASSASSSAPTTARPGKTRALIIPVTSLTWTFWSADWRPEKPGQYTLVSRATDGTGAPQPAETHGIVPQGATGYHRVVATVK